MPSLVLQDTSDAFDSAEVGSGFEYIGIKHRANNGGMRDMIDIFKFDI